ncbi:MAG: hypothetical protein ABIJ45_10295, partial [Candidatus Zixiibacteriota bacterium]
DRDDFNGDTLPRYKVTPSDFNISRLIRPRGLFDNNSNDEKSILLQKHNDTTIPMPYGLSRSWNSEGQLISERCFLNGHLIKSYKEWYNNGQIRAEINYNDKGWKDGKFTYWDENGNIIDSGTYIHGLRNTYFKSGQIKSIDQYYEINRETIDFMNLSGDIGRDYKEYYENGDIKWEKKYAGGQLIGGYLNHPLNAFSYKYPQSKFINPPQNWYSNGIQEYINKHVAYLEYYYENKPKVEFIKDTQENPDTNQYTEWYLNGIAKIKAKSIFKIGGESFHYDTSGTLLSKRIWVEDTFNVKLKNRAYSKPKKGEIPIKSSVYEETSYYSSGAIKSIGNYYSSNFEYRNIEFWREGVFNRPVPNKFKVGRWQYWDDDGNLLREEQWNNGQLISVDSNLSK